MIKNARHSHNNPSWTTPSGIVDVCRRALGGTIDLDPFSSVVANTRIGATRFYTEADDGFEQTWDAVSVFVNPPGGLIARAWRKLCDQVVSAHVTRAAWVGFSVEQLCVLANPARLGETDDERVARSEDTWHPMDFSTCILRKRISFVREDGSTGSPSHGNYITFINVGREHVQRTVGHLGLVFHGVLSVPVS